MPSLQIRNLPQHVYESLAVRARAEHRSLSQQAVVELMRMPETAGRERRVAEARRLRAQLRDAPATGVTPLPEELVREDRDR